MGKVGNGIKFTCYLGRSALEWVGKQLSWPFVAVYSISKFGPILEEYHTQISDYYNSLFDIELLPPKIKWGRENSYNIKGDFLNLRYLPGEEELFLNGPITPPDIRNLASVCEEEGHRYHYNTNESLSKRAKRKRGVLGTPSDREISEGMVISVYTEGVAKAAKIKALKALGFPEISKLYTRCARVSSRPPVVPRDLNIAFIAHRLLESDDGYFRDIANSDYFEAMTKLSPAWGSLEDEVENVSYYVRGIFE